MSSQAGAGMADSAVEVAGIRLVMQKVDQADAKTLRGMIDQLRQTLSDAAIVLASESGGKAIVIVGVSKSVTDKVKAGDLIKQVVTPLGGRGGGRDDMAQAGAPSLDGLEDVFANLPAWVEQMVTAKAG